MRARFVMGRVAGARAWTVLSVALAAQALATYWLLHVSQLPIQVRHARLLLPIVTTPLFGLAVFALSRIRASRRAIATVVLLAGALLQLIALSRPPATSNDDLRYIWDAKVQLAGIDPYRYAPDAPQLDRLHEPLLDSPCPSDAHGCPLLNHPTVHTVYPPIAEGAFAAIRVLSAGGHGGQLPYQVGAVLGALVTTFLLLGHARRRERPLWHAAVWAWCPVVISEFGNNAHIDWLAVALSVAALLAYGAGRLRWAGALLGAATATKLYPAVLAVVMVRRHPSRVVATAVAVVALSYVPHVTAVGAKVLGYLPGYLREEGYSHGSRLLLVGLVVPHPADTVVGVAVLGLIAWWCYRIGDVSRPEIAAATLMGATLLIFTPNYGWYAALLLALVVMSEKWYWLPVAFAPTFTYLYNGEFRNEDWSRPVIYGIAALLTIAMYRASRPISATGMPAAQAPDGLWTIGVR